MKFLKWTVGLAGGALVAVAGGAWAVLGEIVVLLSGAVRSGRRRGEYFARYLEVVHAYWGAWLTY